MNPFIGTGGHGHCFPGATYPFGMMQLSPDTRTEGWDACSGYHYTDHSILGFSHTHLSGTGVPDYCDILLMPGNDTGDFKFEGNNIPDFSSNFDKRNEYAEPGYYKVFLERFGIQTELTVGKRTGMHRYLFKDNRKACVLVNLKHRDPVLTAGFKTIGKNFVSGFRLSSSWAKEQHVYFILKFDKPVLKFEMSKDSLYLLLHFDLDNSNSLITHTAISAVDTDGAEKNMESEFNGFDFEQMKLNTQKYWSNFLSRIKIKERDQDKRIIFYTSLYHCLIHPSLYQDVDGRYRGMDMDIHTTQQDDHYTVFSLWDTYRSTHPLYQLVYPEFNSKFIRTFLRQHKEAGHLPVWELAANETWCMIGNHSIPVIANAFAHKVYDFDTSFARQAIRESLLGKAYSGMNHMSKGYIGAQDESESVSKTIENCVDIAAAQTVGAISLSEFSSRAYWNLYNPSSGFFEARSNQSFNPAFDPREVNFHFTEANAYQYQFGAHHDVDGLIRLFGSKNNFQNENSSFEEKLDKIFRESSEMTGRVQSDITGLIGQYAHGNEPSHHMAYLYNYISRGDKARYYIDQIKSGFYKNAPDGLIGNEDCGQMSSWFVWSALGFYPVNPYNAMLDAGLPSFSKSEIRIPGKERIEIRTNSLSVDNKSCELFRNGLKSPLAININPGDRIEFKFNSAAGLDNNSYKPSTEDQNEAFLLPFVKSGSEVFRDSIRIELASLRNVPIEYRIKGSHQSSVYTTPITLYESGIIEFRHTETTNSWLTARFLKKSDNIGIKLLTEYANQYSASGNDALIDGLTGSLDFRDGYWQGYQGKNLELILHLKNQEMINKIDMRFLQDQKSWILFPSKLELYSSNDGRAFQLIDVIVTDVGINTTGALIETYSFLIKEKAKYFKIKAINSGKMPEWHIGAGGESWIFCDEIISK